MTAVLVTVYLGTLAVLSVGAWWLVRRTFALLSDADRMTRGLGA